MHENRTRIVFNLPLGNIKEEKAANRVLDFLKSQRQADPAVNGFTHSVFRPAVFHGWWRSPEADDWCDDPIVLVFVDLKMDGDLRLSQKIKEWKKTIRSWYRYFGRPQEEI